MSTPGQASDGDRAGTGPAPRVSWTARGFFFLLWCLTLGLLAVAGLRIAWHDGTKPLTWLNAFTFYVYLPAYLVLLAAAWGRRWRLAAVAALVVACHVVWVAPDFRPALRLEPATSPGTQPSLRIFFFNVSLYNSGYEDLLAELAEADPDVIVFAEFNPMLQYVLQRTPFMRAYEYGTDLFGQFAGEVVVLSRIPTDRAQPVWVAQRPYVALDVPVGDRRLRLFALHSPRPMKWPAHDYDGFWSAVLPAIAAQPRPLVVVGDFNGTQHSWVYKQLLADGLRSAHGDRGRGYATTWPNGKFSLPPIRIDHALVSPDVECLRIEEGVGPGSDHKPLIFDVRLRQSSDDRQAN